jgi:hypothetical protein
MIRAQDAANITFARPASLPDDLEAIRAYLGHAPSSSTLRTPAVKAIETPERFVVRKRKQTRSQQVAASAE